MRLRAAVAHDAEKPEAHFARTARGIAKRQWEIAVDAALDLGAFGPNADRLRNREGTVRRDADDRVKTMNYLLAEGAPELQEKQSGRAKESA